MNKLKPVNVKFHFSKLLLPFTELYVAKSVSLINSKRNIESVVK